MNTGTLVFLLNLSFSYYFSLITWLKNLNNFQMSKIQPHGVAYHLLEFCQFQPGIACKSVAYKKPVIWQGVDIEPEGSKFKSHKFLGWAYLATNLPVTFR